MVKQSCFGVSLDNVMYNISVSYYSPIEYYKTQNKKAIVPYCSTYFIVCTVSVYVLHVWYHMNNY